MSFSVLRAPVRRAVLSAPIPKAQLRTSFRKFSTPPPPPKAKSNTALFAGLGAAAVGGIAFYLYSSDSATAKEAGTLAKSGAQIAKAKANFTPTQEDYQKVRFRIHDRPWRAVVSLLYRSTTKLPSCLKKPVNTMVPCKFSAS